MSESESQRIHTIFILNRFGKIDMKYRAFCHSQFSTMKISNFFQGVVYNLMLDHFA